MVETYTQKKSLAGSRKPVSMVFLGGTGAGKTTLLTALKDFVQKKQFKDRSPTQRVTDKKGVSQTKDVRQYSICGGDYQVNIIDTPGLADTEGIFEDEEHLKKISQFLIDAGEFNAICIVMKASACERAQASVLYVINEIRGMLPKDSVANFIVCATSQNKKKFSSDFVGVLEQMKLADVPRISFENSAYQEVDGEQDEDDLDQMEQEYNKTRNNLQQLIDTASKMSYYKSEGIKKIKEQRSLIKEEIQLMMLTMEDCSKAKQSLSEWLEKMSQAGSEAEQYKKFQENTKIKRERYEKMNGRIDTKCVCHSVCHESCNLDHDSELTECWCMEGDTCRICGHSVNQHSHFGWTKIEYYEDAIKIDDWKKKKFEDAEEIKRECKAAAEKVIEKIKAEDEKINYYTKSISELYSELEKIAIVGYNESYEAFIKETIKSTSTRGDLNSKQKQNQIDLLHRSLSEYTQIKTAVVIGVKGIATGIKELAIGISLKVTGLKDTVKEWYLTFKW